MRNDTLAHRSLSVQDRQTCAVAEFEWSNNLSFHFGFMTVLIKINFGKNSGVVSLSTNDVDRVLINSVRFSANVIAVI